MPIRSTQAISATPLSRSILFAYGSMAFPLSAAFIALQVIIPTHYASTTGLTLTTVGLIMLLARLADTFTDPVVGLLSDRTPAWLGKRRIWVVTAAPLLCVATGYLFNPPADANAAYLLCWAVAIYAAGTMILVPLGAWGAELSPLYHQRSRVTSVRALFGLSGTLAALALPVLVLPAESQAMADSLELITWLVIVSLALSLVWVVFCVPDKSAISLPEKTFRASWTLVRKASPFRQLVASFLLNSIANAIPATLFLFYLTYVLDAEDSAGKMLFLYFVCSVVSLPLWLSLSVRFGKHQTWRVAMALACLFFCWTPFLGSEDLVWFALIVACTGFFIGADLMLPNAIMGDLIEWDALEAGYRRPGLFFAIWGTTTKLAFALAVGTAFPLLDVIGFAANTVNTEQALRGLAVLYGLPCIVFKLLSIANMRRYPITQAKHQRILAELAKRDIA